MPGFAVVRDAKPVVLKRTGNGTHFGRAVRSNQAMPPAILIIESHREVAEALHDVVASANYAAIVRSHVQELDEVSPAPAAIIVRVVFEGTGEPTHAVVARLPPNRPPVIAIVRADEEAWEAERLKCDVVLRAPRDLGRLCDVLTKLTR